jgi:hypothetical protein
MAAGVEGAVEDGLGGGGRRERDRHRNERERGTNVDVNLLEGTSESEAAGRVASGRC